MATHDKANWTVVQWTRHVESGGCPSCNQTGTIEHYEQRETVKAWLACDCVQDTRCSLVNIGSVMICQAGHGRQRVVDVIE